MQQTKHKPILIYGPTASGKSALGLRLAQNINGVIVNADALQVYDNWSILSARPSAEDETLAPHVLYGHRAFRETYSVGHWLRDVRKIAENEQRPLIILGGTGLYFTALTQGLADIPETPDDIRAQGNILRSDGGAAAFLPLLDKETLEKTDKNNPMRLQRAWEVLTATGKGLAAWQRDMPPPLLIREETLAYTLNINTNYLNDRIEKRFDVMMKTGAIEECEKMLELGWDPSLPSSRALGATEIIAYLKGELTYSEANEKATIATRQFAKRQRTWLRSKMTNWQTVSIDENTDPETVTNQILSDIAQAG